MAKAIGDGQHFLPDFGSFKVAIRIVLLAVIIAAIITISRNDIFNEKAWQDLNLLTGFALILSLTSVLVLKLFSPLIRRLSVRTGSLLAFLLILMVIIVGTEIMVFALYDLKLTTERWPEWHYSLLLRSVLVGSLISILGLRYLFVAHRSELDSHAEQEARLQALQSRIRPHFLFNSMNSIASLTRSDPALAETALQDLADLFACCSRCAQAGADLGGARDFAPVPGDREAPARRPPESLVAREQRAQVGADPGADAAAAAGKRHLSRHRAALPGRHAAHRDLGRGRNAERDDQQPAAGRAQARARQGNKIAVDNIRLRLESHFGNNASMQAFQEGGQYHVKLRMPIVRG